MPDTDKILEAEESIYALADELERMRDAARILEAAQANSDAVITAAQGVVQATERFSSECGALVGKLASTDLSQQLDLLDGIRGGIERGSAAVLTAVNGLEEQARSEFAQLTKLLEERSAALSREVAKLSAQLSELASAHGKASEERSAALSGEVAKLSAQLSELANAHRTEFGNAKTRSLIAMGFAILSFLAASGALVVLLLR